MLQIDERVDRLERAVETTQLMLQGLIIEMNKSRLHTQEALDRLNGEVTRLGKDFKEEMNRNWEKLSKKLGTFVEDMVIPNVEWIGKKYFNLKDCIDFGEKRKRLHPEDRSREKEFDALAVYGDKIILVEAKSNPKPEYASEFIDFIKNNGFYEFFPEYKNKEIIPVFASLRIPDNVLKQLTKNKIYAMSMKEDTMDLINYDELADIVKN